MIMRPRVRIPPRTPSQSHEKTRTFGLSGSFRHGCGGSRRLSRGRGLRGRRFRRRRRGRGFRLSSWGFRRGGGSGLGRGGRRRVCRRRGLRLSSNLCRDCCLSGRRDGGGLGVLAGHYWHGGIGSVYEVCAVSRGSGYMNVDDEEGGGLGRASFWILRATGRPTGCAAAYLIRLRISS